jgi:hypothetical protein
LQIRAIQLTTNNVSDSQVLGDLLNQISSDELIDSVYTDGAYDTKLCRHVISDRHAHAEIPQEKMQGHGMIGNGIKLRCMMIKTEAKPTKSFNNIHI